MKSKRQAKALKNVSLDSLNIVEYNEYTGTREEFWGEHFVNVLMNVSTNISSYTDTLHDLMCSTISGCSWLGAENDRCG